MLSDSMRYLELDEIAEPLEKAFETTPILSELGWDEKSSFNGLLSVTADAGSLIGESPDFHQLKNPHLLLQIAGR